MKNSLITIITNILNLFVGVFISVIIARLLGPDKKGIYTLVILLPTMIVTFINFGIGPATVFYTGKRRYKSSVIIGNNIFITAFLTGVSFVIGLIIIYFFGNVFFTGAPLKLLFISLLIIPFTLFFQLFSVILQGKEDFKRFNLLNFINKILFLIFSLFIFLWPEVLTVLYTKIAVLIITCFFLFLWVIRREEIVLKPDPQYLKSVFLYGLKAHLSNVITFFNYRFDIMLINFFLNPLAVGLYSVAVNISEQVWLLSRSVSTVILPRISSLESEEKKKSVTAITSRTVVLITFAGILLLYLLSDFLVPILFSNSYVEAILPLKILLIGIFSMSFTRILANDLAGRGFPEYNIYTSVSNLVVNIVLNILLIPGFGINGAALATTVSYSVQAIFTLFIYLKVSGNSLLDVLIIKKSDIKFIKGLIIKRR